MDILKFIEANKNDLEEFKPVLGFETRFYISSFGRLVSHDHRKNTIKFMSPSLDGTKYLSVKLRMKPKALTIRVHSLVANHFCEGKKEDKFWINHIDGNKLNNHYSNLEWVTPARNVQHAVETGLMDFKGSKHPSSKLKNEDVFEIRRLGKAGITHQAIASKFNVSRRQVGDILKGRNWGWLISPETSTNSYNQTLP